MFAVRAGEIAIPSRHELIEHVLPHDERFLVHGFLSRPGA